MKNILLHCRTISKILSQNGDKMHTPNTYTWLSKIWCIGLLFKHRWSSQIRIQISIILRMTKQIISIQDESSCKTFEKKILSFIFFLILLLLFIYFYIQLAYIELQEVYLSRKCCHIQQDIKQQDIIMYCRYKIGAIIQLLWTLQWRKILWVWTREILRLTDVIDKHQTVHCTRLL